MVEVNIARWRFVSYLPGRRRLTLSPRGVSSAAGAAAPTDRRLTGMP